MSILVNCWFTHYFITLVGSNDSFRRKEWVRNEILIDPEPIYTTPTPSSLESRSQVTSAGPHSYILSRVKGPFFRNPRCLVLSPTTEDGRDGLKEKIRENPPVPSFHHQLTSHYHFRRPQRTSGVLQLQVRYSRVLGVSSTHTGRWSGGLYVHLP